MIQTLLALAAAAQSPAHAHPLPLTPEPGTVRLFGDWAVGCDNGWACEAISLPTEDWEIGNGYSITVRRAGGADGYHRIGIRAFEDEAPSTMTLLVDGEFAGTATRNEGDELYHFDPASAQRLAGLMARGGEAELRDPDGGMIESISLDGSYAAILFIEDRQQRAGTVTASAAVGDQPASLVPEPPSVTTIRAMPIADRSGDTAMALPADQAMRLHEARECDGFDEELRRNEAMVLSDARDLILISCSRGAYNFSDVAYVRDADGAVTPAQFDRAFSWGENREIPLLVNVYWNADANELSTYAKGRGIGDCGTAERFVWDGAMFRLVERREMNSCRGSPHWITVYRANVEWVEP
ncbi:DUF1176 domain-containing protein [Parasphingopyxis sp.]|uniref:DUF1176 domain-containing protein n=1 Tax=Parasphingopyxis sp. TaxID=1920299 RepID=UPI002607080B|nr:DUF1176 domain-containing protein [Parasphingopyxis sp.]